MMGNLIRGAGWRDRTDSHYLRPKSVDEFRVFNKAYVREELPSRKPDLHWGILFDDIVKDIQLNRMEGPFQAPNSWLTKTVNNAGAVSLLECPCEDPAVAFAFSICQTNPDGSEKVVEVKTG